MACLICTTPLVLSSWRRMSFGVSRGQGLSHPVSSGGRWPSFVPIEMGGVVEVYSANTVNVHPGRS